MINASHTKTILFVVLILVLGVSIVLNTLLFQLATNYYKEVNEVRRNPLSIYYYPVQPTVKPNTHILVFFGDSRTQMWTPPKNVPFEIVNRGIAAQTSAQILERFDYHVAPLHPQVIVVQACINDLKEMPLFPEGQAGIIADCKANLKQIVDKSVRQNSTIVLTTIFPLSRRVPFARRWYWSNDVANAIVGVNQYIQSLASEQVIIFDSFAILADNTGVVRQEYQGDFLHINQAGYAALNIELERLLVTLAK